MNKILPLLNPLSLTRSTEVGTVFAALKRGPANVADVAQHGGPSQLIHDLARLGLIRRITSAQEEAYELVGRPDVVVGVDLGGTKVHVALSDLSGEILAEDIEPTERRGGLHVVEQIGAIAERLRRECGRDADLPRAAAIGSPGVLDTRSGKVSISPNIAGLEAIDMVAALESRLGCAVRIENDVNLAALGELWHGSAAGMENFAFVALGTGIGMGLVADGQLMRGAHGAAGEIAFLPLGSDPFSTASYPLGPLETAIGSAGILKHYREQGGKAANSVREVFERMSAGEPAAHETLDYTARILAQALMAVRALVDPELIVLGGSIGARIELVERVRDMVASSPVDLAVRASSLGSCAVLVGASRLALTQACELILAPLADDA
jgi:predicted NBD/HSP70 family sugar kinase